MIKIGNILSELLNEELKSKSDKGNRYFEMLKTKKFRHYDGNVLVDFTGDDEKRKDLVSKLSKEDKKKYKEWLKTDEGKESLKLWQSESINENIFKKIEKPSEDRLTFRGDELGLVAQVTIDNKYIVPRTEEILPYKNMEVYGISAPLDPNGNGLNRVERQGYGTKMLQELIDYCIKNGITHIGSMSLNDKSYGLFKKFEENRILEPIINRQDGRTILWKIT